MGLAAKYRIRRYLRVLGQRWRHSAFRIVYVSFSLFSQQVLLASTSFYQKNIYFSIYPTRIYRFIRPYTCSSLSPSSFFSPICSFFCRKWAILPINLRTIRLASRATKQMPSSVSRQKPPSRRCRTRWPLTCRIWFPLKSENFNFLPQNLLVQSLRNSIIKDSRCSSTSIQMS